MRLIEPEDHRDLETAVHLLETNSWAVKAVNLIGQPIEWTVTRLPNSASRIVVTATQAALKKVTDAACFTLGEAGDRWMKTHILATAVSGGIGGFFGIAALPVELPISTTIMLRSIAAIARKEGERLSDPEARLSCVQVFAMGGRTRDDDAVDSAYLTLRAAFADELAKCAAWAAERTFGGTEAPPFMIRFIQGVAARYGILVEEKAAAQAVPLIGAAAGASINMAFTDHFQDKALGHFTCRRLERKYGSPTIEVAYLEILHHLRADRVA